MEFLKTLTAVVVQTNGTTVACSNCDAATHYRTGQHTREHSESGHCTAQTDQEEAQS